MFTTCVPMIYIRDKSDGSKRLVGSDSHDMLKIDDDGKIIYHNMQCGDGTPLGNMYDGDTPDNYSFEFMGEEVDIGYGMTDLVIEMVPWQQAMIKYKQLDRERNQTTQRLLVAVKNPEVQKRIKEAVLKSHQEHLEHIKTAVKEWTKQGMEVEV